jgi:hypothetical protein
MALLTLQVNSERIVSLTEAMDSWMHWIQKIIFHSFRFFFKKQAIQTMLNVFF